MDILDTDILQLNLNTRAVRCLSIIGIVTVGDLTRVSHLDLLRRRQCGQRTIAHIKAQLETHFGLQLAPHGKVRG